MNKYSKRGISLMVLAITIAVVIILASAVILTLSNDKLADKAKKARFMNDFTTVQDGVSLYASGKYNADTRAFDLPLKGYLTTEDKVYIKENVPTLSSKIQELSGFIDSANLAWISSEDIGVNLVKEKEEKGYIMDVATGQIYDYNGDVFEGKRWHTLDGGIDLTGGTNGGIDLTDISGGYIKLTLFYPEGSTERQWRLGNAGELRLDPALQWQYYTEPIRIPIYRLQDVWIRYVLNGKDVIMPPEGTLLVDIVPDELTAKVPKVNVTINYDETATTKEYRIGNSGWIAYTGPFAVTENSIVAARSTKTEEVKDSNGNVVLTRDIYGSDKIFIGNIAMEETELVAPTIERLAPLNGTQKARVKVTYPAGAVQKIYKENYGEEKEYTSEIVITEWGTNILAYYYDSNGKRSKGVEIVINDPGVEPIKAPEAYDPIDPNDLTDPNNPYNPNNPDNPNNPNNPYSPNNPNNPKSPLNPQGEYNPSSPNYNPNPVNPYNPDYNPKYDPTSPENNPEQQAEEESLKLDVNITANPEPLPDATKVGTVTVSITYDSRATEKTYKINDGSIQNYTGSFQITKNSTIYAYAKGANNASGSATKLIDNLLSGISKPVITPNPSESTKSAAVKVGVQFDKNATIKKYSINGGVLTDYTGEFEIKQNGAVIYAYNENAIGEKAESTYTVNNVDIEQPLQVEEAPIDKTLVLDKGKYYIMKLSYPENSYIKEYRFTETGIWTPYNADGIMLIRAQYKDEVLANIQENGILKIKDDSGNTVDFHGEWYVINTTVEALIESLFMRWNIAGISGVQILENTSLPAKDVMITIVYPDANKAKKYKVVKPGDPIPDTWLDYTAPFKVDTNNTTIYAKYVNEYGDESAETTYKVTNIDEESPVIALVADLVTYQDQIPVKVNVTDNVEVGIVKWDSGLQGESYFANNGIEILNNSTINITANGVYTIYAEDTVGNKQTYTLTITNTKIPPTVTYTPNSQTDVKLASTRVDVATEQGTVDASSLQYVWSTSNTVEPTSEWATFTNGQTITKDTVTGTYYLWIKAGNTVGGKIVSKSGAFVIDNTAPANPIMSASPTTWTNESVTVTITYPADTVTKQYSLNGTTWNTYTSGVAVTENNTTVYAKGIDAAGNQSGQSTLTVMNIDKSVPTKPTLSSNPDTINNSVITPVAGGTPITFTASSTITSPWKTIEKYIWTISNGGGTAYTQETTTGSLNILFNNGISSVTVCSVDSGGVHSQTTGTAFTIMADATRQSISGVGVSTMDSVIIPNATVSGYSFTVVVSTGHSGSDWWRVEGLTTGGVWENVNPVGSLGSSNSVSNGIITGQRTLPDPTRYKQLRFQYSVASGHLACLTTNSYISYSVQYKF